MPSGGPVPGPPARAEITPQGTKRQGGCGHRNAVAQRGVDQARVPQRKAAQDGGHGVTFLPGDGVTFDARAQPQRAA